jgi:hypothetical protein
MRGSYLRPFIVIAAVALVGYVLEMAFLIAIPVRGNGLVFGLYELAICTLTNWPMVSTR